MATLLKTVEGTVLYSDGSRLVRAVGASIDICDEGTGDSFKSIATIKRGLFKNLLSKSRLCSRGLRTDVKQCVRMNPAEFLLVADRNFYVLDINQQSIVSHAPIQGSRPLKIAVGQDGSIYYGEYHRNPERKPIGIWCSTDAGRVWQKIAMLEGIRHIHGIFADPIDNDIFWITTGDFDNESHIWRATDNFRKVEKVHSAGQQSRVIQLLFDNGCILFGTDTTSETNAIYKMDDASAEVTKLGNVIGPVFHGYSQNGYHYFSTACEPETVNQTNRVAVYRTDGIKLNQMLHTTKDFWSMKYLQYGQITFPSGTCAGQSIWLSFFATKGDNRSYCYRF